MDNRLAQRTEFFAQTQAIYNQAQRLRADMEKNEADQLEILQDLFDRRQQTLEALAEKPAGEWSEQERSVIEDIQQTEIQLQPLMTNLHEQFSVQMNRLNQTRQASGKYAGANRQTASGGSFIDQRK